MVKYNGIDYGKPVDTAAQIADVKTKFKYGDLNAVNNPWITVLVPTYRRVDMLKEALKTVLSQWHCDFMWDIVVLDNEADDDKQNDTERLIRELDSKRILYYRNSKNIRPGDNFNRGMQIARGEWVCFLHDDDLLISNALQKIGKLIRVFSKKQGLPLGAISAQYYKFTYNPATKLSNVNLSEVNNALTYMPLYYGLYPITHSNLWFTANIGGDVPSNGTVFNRKAALSYGGFVEDFGISSDLMLFHRLENTYSVYSTVQPLGMYRWGSNSMTKPESTRRVIKDGYDYREYVYSRTLATRLFGAMLRKCHYKIFSNQVIAAKNQGEEKAKQIDGKEFFLDGVGEPQRWWYIIFRYVIQRLYYRHKYHQTKRNEKIAQKILKQEEINT